MLARIDAVATTDVALSVSDLTVSLPLDMERQYAVENLSFDLKRGQILCIIGESGSGKSVTANAIMGLLPKVIRVTGGAIDLEGRSIMGLPAGELRSLRGRVESVAEHVAEDAGARRAAEAAAEEPDRVVEHRAVVVVVHRGGDALAVAARGVVLQLFDECRQDRLHQPHDVVETEPELLGQGEQRLRRERATERVEEIGLRLVGHGGRA